MEIIFYDILLFLFIGRTNVACDVLYFKKVYG